MSATTAYTGQAPRGNTFGRVALPPVGLTPEGPVPQSAPVGEVTWDEALALYETFCNASALSLRTIGTRIATLQLVQRYYGGSPANVTFAQLLAMQNRPIAPSTKQAQRSIFQQFFLWLQDEGIAADNPARRLPRVRVPKPAPRPLTVSQVERMLEVTTHRKTRTMILLGAYAGMRVSEIASVRGEMFDLESNQLRFIGKGGHKRSIEIHPIIRGEILHYPRHGYWFPSGSNAKPGQPHVHGRTVGDLLHRSMLRAGIDSPELTAHSLRHFFASELLAAGTDIRVVQELLGHQQLNSTQIYTRVSSVMARQGLMSLPEVTLPGAHYSRRHRRAWLQLSDAANLLGVNLTVAARLAQEHSWRYTANEDKLVYSIVDVEATAERLAKGAA